MSWLSVLTFILNINLNASDHCLVISGLAWHGREENLEGREYDVLIAGAGYQYRKDWWSVTGLGINDSNGEFMASATFGMAYSLGYNVSLGAEAGIASRVSGAERYLIPILLPKLEIAYEALVFNASFIPKIKTDNIDIPMAVYVNISLRLYTTDR